MRSIAMNRRFEFQEVASAIKRISADHPDIWKKLLDHEIGAVPIGDNEYRSFIMIIRTTAEAAVPTNTLQETNRLMFEIRKEMRRMLDLPI